MIYAPLYYDGHKFDFDDPFQILQFITHVYAKVKVQSSEDDSSGESYKDEDLKVFEVLDFEASAMITAWLKKHQLLIAPRMLAEEPKTVAISASEIFHKISLVDSKQDIYQIGTLFYADHRQAVDGLYQALSSRDTIYSTYMSWQKGEMKTIIYQMIGPPQDDLIT